MGSETEIKIALLFPESVLGMQGQQGFGRLTLAGDLLNPPAWRLRALARALAAPMAQLGKLAILGIAPQERAYATSPS
jgi:hypothetical protein